MLGHKIFEKQSTQFMLLKVHKGIKHGKGWAKFCLPEPVLQRVQLQTSSKEHDLLTFLAFYNIPKVNRTKLSVRHIWLD